MPSLNAFVPIGYAVALVCVSCLACPQCLLAREISGERGPAAHAYVTDSPAAPTPEDATPGIARTGEAKDGLLLAQYDEAIDDPVAEPMTALPAAVPENPPQAAAAASAPLRPASGGSRSKPQPVFPSPYILATGVPAAGGVPLPSPWKNTFFDNDFEYKNDPEHEWLLGENLKDIDLHGWGLTQLRMPEVDGYGNLQNMDRQEFLPLESFPEPLRISYGGQVRFRQMDEANRLRPGAPGRGDYQLIRWRQYVDLKVSDWLRVYAEMIDAQMDNNALPATGIDINRWDAQNLFVDVRLAEFDDGRAVWFRPGRQELSYGSQRLLSSFDWTNTRRNFEGLKFFTRGKDWDFDLWFTRPVNTATFGDGPLAQFENHFDSPNMNHTFSGAWFTYKAMANQLVDLYWLWDRNSQLVQPGFAGGNRHTVATRWLRHFPVGDGGDPERTWHSEVEGGYQFGDDFGKDVSAGFVVAGAGHTWNDVPWQPDLWFYYDWASGSSNPNGGTTSTFSQQYGLPHAFLGQIDNIARQNISDINGKFTVNPLKQLSFQTQYHWFDLANTGDVLYTITGSPLGKPHTGRHVGEELDLVSTYTFSPNFNVQVGYMWFWYGQFVENNAPRGTAEQLYIQTTLNY